MKLIIASCLLLLLELSHFANSIPHSQGPQQQGVEDAFVTLDYPEYGKVYRERIPLDSIDAIHGHLSLDKNSSDSEIRSVEASFMSCVPFDPSIRSQGIYKTIDDACHKFLEYGGYWMERGIRYSVRLPAANPKYRSFYYDIVFQVYNPHWAAFDGQSFVEYWCVGYLRAVEDVCATKVEKVMDMGRRIPKRMIFSITNKDSVDWSGLLEDWVYTVTLERRS
ncbi:hypothetical protein BJ508DRAFT_43427 [Ascobolus immersus RN42]|uniref:Uncharacterized protein n=1 Tax=Ascobolus immersus RN42 TaxID=1160509 RepID=A0A3N4IJC7_ASCIM|nr:hypothetical protein BJ508DRAFT_43427 [Ascobolus immersus RN42]